MLDFLATAAVSCSAGFVLGGLMTSSKVMALYERLAVAEGIIKEQGYIVRDLANAARISFGSPEARKADGAGADGLSEAQGLLAKCDVFLSGQERAREEEAA